MTPFEKKIKILDANRNRFVLNIEVTERNWYPQFTMSAESGMGSGQCYDSISPWTEAQKKIIEDFRKHYHLKEIDQGIYDELTEQIIPELEEESKTDPLTDDDIGALQENYTDREIAVALMLDLSESELVEDVKGNCDDTDITIQWTDYYFGTDEEMDDKWDEYLESYIDDCIIDKIPEQYQTYFDREWRKDDAKQDWRWHCLDSWNGWEESVKIADTRYYIYQR